MDKQRRLVWDLVLALLVASGTVTQAHGNRQDDVPPAETTSGVTVFCECVYYFLCEDGVIITDGSSLLDIRSGGVTTPALPPEVNVEVCADVLKICCRLPEAETTTAITSTTPRYPPDTPCECVSWSKCPLDRVVSDYGGNTTLEIRGLRSSHSKCHHSLAVCCAIETTTTSTTLPTTTTPRNPGEPKCECVPFYQCDDEGYINEYGFGLIDIRMANTGRDCGGDDDLICCYFRKDNNVTTTTTSSTTSTTTATTEPTTTTPFTIPPPKYECGTRNPVGTEVRVLGFKDGQSQFAEYPWVVAVLRLEEYIATNRSLFFVGGGSLIHPRVVLTAAHKVYDLDLGKLYVRVGEWDTQSQQEPEVHQDIKVESVLIHPRFHRKALWFNFALLFLEEEARSAPHIHHICPAKSVEDVSWDACVINGWGKNAFDDNGEYQKILKSVDVPLVGKKDCQRLLRKTRLGRFFRLHQTFICAGGEKGKDTCWGDGGGPLACPTKDTPDRYSLVGITSWGIGCGDEGVPGVYADVANQYQWIMDNIYERFPTTTTSTTTTSTTTFTTTSSTTVRHRTTQEPGTTPDYPKADDLYENEYGEDEDYDEDEDWSVDNLNGNRREKKKKRRKKNKKNKRKNKNKLIRRFWRAHKEKKNRNQRG